MFNKIIPIIDSSKNVLILPHISLDGDALGSSYALRLILLKMGKNAYVMQDAEHRLTKALYGVSDNTPLSRYDLAIAVDCGDIGRLEKREEHYNLCPNKIVIDHHRTHTDFGDVDVVNPSSASTGEMIYELANVLNLGIDKQIATNLYMAMSSDTGGFTFANTAPDTMRTAALLMEAGAKFVTINTELFAKNTMTQLNLKRVALESMTVHGGGKISCIAITTAQMDAVGATPDDCEGLVSLARSLDTAEVALLIKETERGVKVSMRSDGKIDVSALCSKHGGGGHVRAAGCILDFGIDQAKKIIIDELEELL